MRIAPRVDLGLRLVVAVADLSRATGLPVARSALLERVEITEASLLTILGDLRKREIVRSRRGVNGGWVLARPADEITVAQVVAALDGPVAVPPVSGRTRFGPAVASDGVADVWTRLGVAVHAVLGRTTIADLAEQIAAEPAAAAPAAPRGWYDTAS